MASRVPYSLKRRGIDMERLKLLKGITFGERVAEDETNALGQYFVETDQWERIFDGKIDVVRGDKGSGKSAIFSLLDSKANQLFDRRVLLTTAENPRGDTVFSDLVSEPPTSENEFIFLWKLYYVSLVAAKLKEFDIANDKAKELFKALERAGILERHALRIVLGRPTGFYLRPQAIWSASTCSSLFSRTMSSGDVQSASWASRASRTASLTLRRSPRSSFDKRITT